MPRSMSRSCQIKLDLNRFTQMSSSMSRSCQIKMREIVKPCRWSLSRIERIIPSTALVYRVKPWIEGGWGSCSAGKISPLGPYNIDNIQGILPQLVNLTIRYNLLYPTIQLISRGSCHNIVNFTIRYNLSYPTKCFTKRN